MTTTNKTWKSFYEKRVKNRSYEHYFFYRYLPMIKVIAQRVIENDTTIKIREEGCGIMSIYKALVKRVSPIILDYTGIDTPSMIELAQQNIPQNHHERITLYSDDICHPLKSMEKADLVITHGVLEHFADWKILNLLKRLEDKKEDSMHYVPLDKYLYASFGDERLLSASYWINLTNPTEALVFNEGHDLLLTFKH